MKVKCHLKIGDFVTTTYNGYWQVVDLKEKIATSDYRDYTFNWKKGDLIGYFAILKKAFTPKMKPDIKFEVVDYKLCTRLSSISQEKVDAYFANNPDFKQKFDNTPIELRPEITNCWLHLPYQEEQNFRDLLKNLPEKFTLEQFWSYVPDYEKFALNPPSNYLLNWFCQPFDFDKDGQQLYMGYELIKNDN